ncbi:MAG: toll/interleukin-1 receptor domain-containing protein [Bacillota bacterium]|nr:toll/interleukin-1 receptor domain-containing protein [Bacillota bacterium]
MAEFEDGRAGTYQCRQRQRVTAEDVAKVIEETKYEADFHVLVVSCEVGGDVREAVKDVPDWSVWDVRDISQRVRLLPRESAARLVEGHFGPDWRKVFVGVNVQNSFLEPDPWSSTYMLGSSLQLELGIAGTKSEPCGHDPSWLPLEGTAILGDSGKSNPPNPSNRTVAHWEIPRPDCPLDLFMRGYLIVGCQRRFGGLHSPTIKDRVEILLNGSLLDGFELQFSPPGHNDFFHEAPYPDVPLIAPFKDCSTVYAWNIPRNYLTDTVIQRLTIRLDRDVKWDIDYIGFLFEGAPRPHQVFISHNWGDKEVARQLGAQLDSLGIGVWIDEAEINLGDSLLERISQAIDSVDYVLVLLSKNSIQSSWVQKEVQIAMTQEISGKRVKVFAVVLDDVTLPSYLVDKAYADLRDMSNLPKVLSQIVRRVRG